VKPDPVGGLVFRYDYLWVSQEAEGWEEGAKIRPCAIAVVMLPNRSGATRVVACAITHSKPRPPTEGIEIPPRVKAYLGLDDERSWIVTSEVNLVDWEDPGIVPVAPGQWFHGTLPPVLAKQIRDEIVSLHEARRLPLVNRP
jgi:hypothetical protein